MERPLISQTLSSDTAQSTQVGDYDMKSFQTNSPLPTPSTYPLSSQPMANLNNFARMPDEVKGRSHFEPHTERTASHQGVPYDNSRPPISGSSGYEILAGIKKFEHDYEQYDAKNASAAFAYADVDVPNDKLTRLYNYLINVSVVTRWTIFIVPILIAMWIPGVLSFTKFPKAEVWGVRLLWWSTWLSVVWLGWWTSLAIASFAPYILRKTVGMMAVGTRQYIDWFAALYRYIALFTWCLAMWISFVPLINSKQNAAVGSNSSKIISLIQKLLFALFLCAGLLLFEKFSIQWIAWKFHELSYADRIAEQKFAVKVLVTLYRYSNNILGRSDTLNTTNAITPQPLQLRRIFKEALRGVRIAATTTTTAFGNVASEITGTSVLQPDSPAAIVKVAVESANKSRLLARRLFYSFAKPRATELYMEDIAKYFPSQHAAHAAFALFDKDANGDVTRDEMEAACLEIHREQLSLEHSMSDMDSAVGRLDNLFISLYVVIAALIVAVALETQLAALITGAGTLLLGLSWLIGGSLQEVLTCIIFLFVKHPFDVGDKISILNNTYTVKEIMLLSTIFLDAQGCIVQAPNVILNTSYIQNIRRSEEMSETFPFDVAYNTSFEQLEALRDKMFEFLQTEKRDFLPVFDVVVTDFPNQETLSLKVDIKYKSNWQQGALKTKRRNKWICALKISLAEVKIFGSKGNPNAVAAPERRTLVPWDEVMAKEEAALREESTKPKTPTGGWQLLDKNTFITEDSGDVFDESDELHTPNPRRGLSSTRQTPSARPSTSTPAVPPPPTANTTNSPASPAMAAELIEMAFKTKTDG